MHMLDCLWGTTLSETGQKQSLRQNYGRLSKNGQSLVLMSGVLRAIRFGRALRTRGVSGLRTIWGRPCFPCASQSGFVESGALSDTSAISPLADLDPLPPNQRVWLLRANAVALTGPV